MADTSTNFFINSAYSPSFDITWSFQFQLTGTSESNGGFSTFLFENDTLVDGGGYTGLGFAPYESTKGITGPILGLMIDTSNILTIKTGSNFSTLTTFHIKMNGSNYSLLNKPFITMRCNLTDLGQTFNVDIKDPITDIYKSVISIGTGLKPTDSEFFRIGFGYASPLVAGDEKTLINLKDIHTQGSLVRPTTKISDPPYVLPVDETYYLIQSPTSSKLNIGIPDPKIDGALLWSYGSLNRLKSKEAVFSGSILTIAGGISSDTGYVDNENHLDSRFGFSYGIVKDSNNNLFVSDTSNSAIRKISFKDGVSTFINITDPEGLCIDSSDNLYVSCPLLSRIYKIDTNGNTTIIAGDPEGRSGDVNANGTNARFNAPNAIVIDKDGNLFVADTLNYKIKKITPNGDVTTVTGTVLGNRNGIKSLVKLGEINGLVIDNDTGIIYATDNTNNSIRKIMPNGSASTFAGGTQGDSDGNGSNAQFNFPSGITNDNFGNLYVCDTFNFKIKKISSTADVTTIAGFAESTGTILDGNILIANLLAPTGILVDSLGYIFITDGYLVRKIT
jgi:hypothetical protein